MSLRGAQRRGNLFQVVDAQNEAAPRRREIAAPYGLAMTYFFRARNDVDSFKHNVGKPSCAACRIRLNSAALH